ncbi:hypothetical protein [Bradyrhizobium sp. LA7.1]|uniref:hypothetical protein n=1 Tax=Bradyrhizobium sp. LA7.1 TaxID=3156324 RepID=UPI003398CCCD
MRDLRALPRRGDLLDLNETALWRNPWISEMEARRGKALALFFACTGAGCAEARSLTYDPRQPPAEWLDLPGQDLVRPRRVWLPKIVAMAIRHYREEADKITSCDRLFVDGRGNPICQTVINVQFRRLGARIGVDARKLASRLGDAYVAWVRSSEDQLTALYLAGSLKLDETQRQAVLPSAKKKLIEDVHPLGKLDRDMVRWEGAVARHQRTHPLRVLSTEAKAELKKAREKLRVTGRHEAYPQELRTAVREALAAGWDPVVVSRHYGVTKSFERIRGKPQLFNKLDGKEDAIRALFAGSIAPTFVEVSAFVSESLGLHACHPTVLAKLRSMGLQCRHPNAHPLGRRRAASSKTKLLITA